MREIKENKDGRIFIGEIKNGKLDGEGILILKSNGKAYNVNFDDGSVYRISKIQLSEKGEKLNEMIKSGNLKAPLITPGKEVLENFHKENKKRKSESPNEQDTKIKRPKKKNQKSFVNWVFSHYTPNE